MSVEVFVVNATGVPNVETIGKSDPYVSAEFQGEFSQICLTIKPNSPQVYRDCENTDP